MTMTSPSCESLIAGQLASRAAYVAQLLAANRGEVLCKHCHEQIELGDWHAELDTDEDEWAHVLTANPFCDGEQGFHHAEPDEDLTEDSLYEFGLGLSRKVVLRFEMSTGGPADWLEIVCDEDPKYSVPGIRLVVDRVVYHYADWFDHAEETVIDGPLFELAEWIAETQS